MNIGIIGQITLKSRVTLCGLLYFYVLELTLFVLKLLLAQQDH